MSNGWKDLKPQPGQWGLPRTNILSQKLLWSIENVAAFFYQAIIFLGDRKRIQIPENCNCKLVLQLWVGHGGMLKSSIGQCSILRAVCERKGRKKRPWPLARKVKEAKEVRSKKQRVNGGVRDGWSWWWSWWWSG